MTDGLFYLGKKVSIKDDSLTENDFLYKTNHLTTHGMIFGMTGSGKTGLSIDIMEEAINEEIPIIIIDPKGDLANLALIFPDFSPENFKPWVSASEAAKHNLPIDQYAKEIAEKWKKGVNSWGITDQKIKEIKEKADIKLFTPGSSAGMRISILDGFKKPEINFEEDEEGMVEKIRNSVSALLALLDIDNDPLKSKPHILISNIIEYYWRLGRSVSIEDLIINIQKPPIKKLGVFDVDTLISEKERTEIAFEINNIVASPGFRFWTSGTPLSAETLYKKNKQEGTTKVPVNIFYIAHLPENERMFFVTLLLNEIVYWMRKQPGSGSLKYMLYMDEIFGYLPPYPKNPPSKNPLLVLLKQARAFGLGVALATQNPKDVDYKALTNMGTWFVGKLQADGDRERVLEGLGGITLESGEAIDNNSLEKVMASLNNRRFLVKDIHSNGLNIFQTRWAISYLAGPVTREQIKTLTSEAKALQETKKQAAAAPAPAAQIAQTTPTASSPKAETTKQASTTKKHLLPFAPEPEIPLECIYDNTIGESGYYSPMLYLEGEVIFDEKSLGLYIRKNFYVTAPLKAAINWRKTTIVEERQQYSPAPINIPQGYVPLDLKLNYTILKRIQSSFKNFLYSNLSLDLYVNKKLNLVSEVGESKSAFEQRCRDIIERTIDKEIEQKKEQYLKKIKRLEDRIESEQLKVERYQSSHRMKQTEEFVSAGESILGLFFGKKSRSRLSTAARRRRATSTAASRVNSAKNKIEQLEEDLLPLQEELEDKVMEIEDSHYNNADSVEPFEVRMEKNDIIISNLAILWKLMK